MNYIDDNLKFLENVESEKLERLHQILMYRKDGKNRSTAFDESFELYHQNEDERKIKNWRIFAKEIQCFGGNSLANTIRRNGVRYEEIVNDVANKMELSDSLKEKSIEEKECGIIEELRKHLRKLKVEQLLEKEGIVKKRKQISEDKTLTDEQKNKKLDEIKNQEIFIKENEQRRFCSIEYLQNILREEYDSSSGMEFLLQDIGAGRKSAFFKFGNLILDYPYFYLKALNPNWSVVVQSIVEISQLRKIAAGSKKSLSIAIIGPVGAGKSTLQKALITGKFEEMLPSYKLEKETSFVSPGLNAMIDKVVAAPGGRDWDDAQKEICINANLAFFCFNPKEVLGTLEKERDFFSRLTFLKDINEAEKIIFIATHRDMYDERDVYQKLHEKFHAKDMRNLSVKLKNLDECLFVNLKDDEQTKKMFEQIKEKYL